MFKKYLHWFVCFGLSLFISDVLKWTTQGKAFLYVYLGGYVAIILISSLFVVELCLTDGLIKKAKIGSFLAILLTIILVGISLFATWGATKLFNIDFYVAYEIMTFGQCLCGTDLNENNNKKHKKKQHILIYRNNDEYR